MLFVKSLSLKERTYLTVLVNKESGTDYDLDYLPFIRREVLFRSLAKYKGRARKLKFETIQRIASRAAGVKISL